MTMPSMKTLGTRAEIAALLFLTRVWPDYIWIRSRAQVFEGGADITGLPTSVLGFPVLVEVKKAANDTVIYQPKGGVRTQLIALKEMASLVKPYAHPILLVAFPRGKTYDCCVCDGPHVSDSGHRPVSYAIRAWDLFERENPALTYWKVDEPDGAIDELRWGA